ncbi:E3 ubiquitin-protein ligase RNF168 [Zootoca vivipara]|uniref:E3 ubiquitin-protein ligase RNF168 n=1 Tax=Zootoca vivipara TaxID=8524 RepID=UPI00158FE43A|nr:E3 ubiquitin-protein ligase RNF168 [Zootoca vivipara]XP_034989088.1 E3 ubiquitin-protein ligase RNF168 [Zootoca vivipara]XP_034989089.1 E3 ubiquitin-protein ligase RNF168 [Zootoca vivipara]XP_060130565.1 E3 ubiquitin-protein ligase RNF168 [Zootoca vivipara]
MSKKSEAPLSLSDCRCNICMEILLEPVTLPCNHTLCNSCFQLTVEKSSLYCPFCRRRVSSWARYNARNNTLINLELWEKIQKHFPEECQRRISGQDIEEDMCLHQPVRCLSKPGELRQEYEEEISKVEAERLAHEEEASNASKEYIQRLLAEEEEEQRLAEERKKQMEEQLLLDEILAQKLSCDLNSSAEEHMKSSLSPGPSPSDSGKTSKSKCCSFVDIKKYLSPKPFNSLPPMRCLKKLQEEHSGSFSEESSNTKNICTSREKGRENEMPTLSPQAIREAKRGADGYDYKNESFTTDMQLRTSQESFPEAAADSYLNDKRKRIFSQTDDEEEMDDIERQISLEQQFYERQKQEEEDRRLALKLQREMYKEQNMLNRQKGSPDEYHLRPTTSQSVKESPVARKRSRLSKNSKSSNSPLETDKRKLHRNSHNENWKPSNQLQAKSPSVKGGNVLNCVNSSNSKDAEVLSSKQTTILQMFKRPATN